MQRQASGRQVIDKGIQYLATSEWQTTRQKWIGVVSSVAHGLLGPRIRHWYVAESCPPQLITR